MDNDAILASDLWYASIQSHSAVNPITKSAQNIGPPRSTQALVQALKEFQSLGVDFISYQENIDTTTPQGEMIFTMMASLAQFESTLMSERVKAGMARAKAQGKRISQSPIAKGIQVRSAEFHEQGIFLHQISKQLGIGYGTVWNYVQHAKQELSP